jgi:hypothetical protein
MRYTVSSASVGLVSSSEADADHPVTAVVCDVFVRHVAMNSWNRNLQNPSKKGSKATSPLLVNHVLTTI